MTTLARITEIVFVAACLIGVGAWAYAIRFWFRDWKVDRGPEFKRNFAFGAGIVILALVIALASGTVAELWGDDWR